MGLSNNMLGSLSASTREDNVFKVFAYLNTRKEFTPLDVRTRVSVSNKTILSYLWEIAKYQTCQEDFVARVNSGKGVQWYIGDKGASEKAKEIADETYSKLSQLVKKPIDRKGQFTFDSDMGYRATFYYRLESCLLFYGMLANQK